MRRHLSMSVDGALKMKRKLHHLLQDETGKLLTDKEAREHLRECQARGIKKIMVGDCDNFDPIKGCMGHPSDNQQTQPS
ncbi:MAG TPA: hypothetical protein VKU83_11565 [Puia sp.]|nr:hypothetical protein [Puia sp.]